MGLRRGFAIPSCPFEPEAVKHGFQWALQVDAPFTPARQRRFVDNDIALGRVDGDDAPIREIVAVHPIDVDEVCPHLHTYPDLAVFTTLHASLQNRKGPPPPFDGERPLGSPMGYGPGYGGTSLVLP